MQRAKSKPLIKAASFRSVLAFFLTLLMLSLLRAVGVVEALSTLFPNTEGGGDLFVLVWCFAFLAFRVAMAWWPVWKSVKDEAK